MFWQNEIIVDDHGDDDIEIVPSPCKPSIATSASEAYRPLSNLLPFRSVFASV